MNSFIVNRRTFEIMPKRVTHLIRARQDVSIPETAHPEALSCQPSVVLGIIGALGMLAAINLHDQALRRTDEIGNVSADLDLPSEFEATEAAITQ